MLFIIIMDVLISSLVAKAEDLNLLQLPANRRPGHRISIYADDVVFFASPCTGDISTVKVILSCFGEASGLQANLSKSSIVPICCDEAQTTHVQEQMECTMTSFPCKYHGLPLSLKRLTAADLQPILDKIVDALPTWKEAMMSTAGRLVVVRVVLTAIPIYMLMALDVSRWFIKAVDRFRRSFLWRGRADTRGGHCPVNWERVTRPLHLGGLGIHNLQLLGWALRMRWLWYQKTDRDRAWAFAEI